MTAALAAVVLGVTPLAGRADAYDSTLRLCRDHAEVGLSRLDRIIYAATYLYRREAGDPFLPSARVRLTDDAVLRRNLMAAAGFDLGQDRELRRLLQSPDFYRALNDCFPESRYANAAQLRGAFVIELLAQEGTGKALGLGLAAGSFKAVGLVLGRLGAVSARAYRWVSRAMLAGGATGAAYMIAAREVSRRAEDQLLPRERRAREAKADELTRQRALGADLVDLARAGGVMWDLELDSVNAEMDQMIHALEAERDGLTDPAAREFLTRKIAILRDARGN